MGFREIRAVLIEALRSKQYGTELRPSLAKKNLLASGAVDEAFVIRPLLRCAGWEYSVSKHHFLDVDCHVFTPAMEGERWYVKAFLEPGLAVFISVHP